MSALLRFYPSDSSCYYYKIIGNIKIFYFKHNDKSIELGVLPQSLMKNIKEYDSRYVIADEYNKLDDIMKIQCKFEVEIVRYKTIIDRLKTDIDGLKMIYGDEIYNITRYDHNYYYFKIVGKSKQYYTYSGYRLVKDYNFKNDILNKKAVPRLLPFEKKCNPKKYIKKKSSLLEH